MIVKTVLSYSSCICLKAAGNSYIELYLLNGFEHHKLEITLLQVRAGNPKGEKWKPRKNR
jgi:hypothetical protein